MSLTELLGVRSGVTAVIGSGGKTTLLRTLGEELAGRGQRVVLCTTTKIFPFDGLTNLITPTEDALIQALSDRKLVCAGSALANSGKLTAPRIPLRRLAELADCVLVEADGAAHRPLKAHAPHEPAIPPEAERVLCVVGVSGLGQPIVRAAHRPEIFSRLAGVSPSAPATIEAVAAVLNAEMLGECYFLNQADVPEERVQAGRLARLLHRPTVMGSLWKGVYAACGF